MMDQLIYAEAHNESVLIIGHIPPGDVFALSDWSEVYRLLMNRFAHIIKGQFYGHTHYDEFKVVKGY